MEINNDQILIYQPIDKFIPIGTNTMEFDLKKSSIIKSSLRMFGQIKPIICIDNKNGTFNVIEGRKVLQCMREIGINMVFGLSLSKDYNPDLLNLMINLSNSEIDNIGMSEVIHELIKEYPPYILCNYLPFNADTIKYYDKLHNFDWSDFDKEASSIKQMNIFDNE